MIRHQLDSALSNDEDSQRWLYNQFRIQAPGILIQLARVLYLFSGIKVNLPKTLEHQLLCGYKELTADVNVVLRDWQCQRNRDEYFQRLLTKEKESSKSETGEGLTPAVSTSNMSSESVNIKGKSSQDEDTKSVKSDKAAPAPARVRPRPVSRQSALADIVESEGELTRRSSSRLHGEVPTIVAPARRESFRMSGTMTPNLQQRPKTRIEKFRTGMYLDPNSGKLVKQHGKKSVVHLLQVECKFAI